MADHKIVLAYSGGLDTSCILKYLQEKGYQVVAFIADLGQEDDMSALERRAHDQGAVAVHVRDLRRTFVTEFVLPALAGNALYENRDRVQSRGALLDSVWGMDVSITTRTVDTHVKRLRDKLQRAGEYVATVRGSGERCAGSPALPAAHAEAR